MEQELDARLAAPDARRLARRSESTNVRRRPVAVGSLRDGRSSERLLCRKRRDVEEHDRDDPQEQHDRHGARPAEVLVVNSSKNIFRAMTSVPNAPLVNVYTMSNDLSAVITIVVPTTKIVGISSGRMIPRNTCHSLAPSTRAASSSSDADALEPGRG